MRRLARRSTAIACGVRHADSKNALLDGVVEVALSELEVPATVDGEWETVLRRSAHAFRALRSSTPEWCAAGHTAVGHAAGDAAAGLPAAAGELLELFVVAGLDGRGAAALRIYIGFLYGHVPTSCRRNVQKPDETESRGGWALHGCRPRVHRGYAHCR